MALLTRFLILFFVIKNYSFGLSAFIFSISGVKIFQFSPLKTVLSTVVYRYRSEVGSKYEKHILWYNILEAGKCSCRFPCLGSDGGGHDDRADHSGEQAGHQGTRGLGGEFEDSARALLVMFGICIRLDANLNPNQSPLQFTWMRLRIRALPAHYK